MSKNECCGEHIYRMNEGYDKFGDDDYYYYDNFKNDEFDLDIYKSETQKNSIL